MMHPLILLCNYKHSCEVIILQYLIIFHKSIEDDQSSAFPFVKADSSMESNKEQLQSVDENKGRSTTPSSIEIYEISNYTQNVEQ